MERLAVDDAKAVSVTILGAGFIGLSFTAAFSDAGMAVTLVEPDGKRRSAAPAGMDLQFGAIETAGLARGGTGPVTLADRLHDAAAGADLILECGPERLEVKQAIFAELLDRAAPGAVLATASSAIPVSQIVTDPAARSRCIVAHPANPPAVLRMVELAPAPGTLPETTARAADIFGAAGFTPVTLGGEIEGFVMNRLQGAVLREAYRLVADGIATVEGIDTVMRMTLGPRWCLSGPFETAELNTPGGIAAHAARLGPAYRRMGEARGETVDWSPKLVAEVERQRRRVLPAADIPARAAWRTGAVARIVAARDRIADDDDG